MALTHGEGEDVPRMEISWGMESAQMVSEQFQTVELNKMMLFLRDH